MTFKTMAAASIVLGLAVAPTVAQAASTIPAVNQAVIVSTPIYDDDGNLLEVRFEYSLVCDPDFNCQV